MLHLFFKDIIFLIFVARISFIANFREILWTVGISQSSAIDVENVNNSQSADFELNKTDQNADKKKENNRETQ